LQGAARLKLCRHPDTRNYSHQIKVEVKAHEEGQEEMIEKFRGKKISELNWKELIKYNVALALLNNPSGNTDCGRAAKLGITWEYAEKGDNKK
jgi:hypothetical protein